MTIPGINASDPFSIGLADGLPTQDLGRNAFMQLLVTQLENQDPLEPLKNDEFLAQLATFSSLEQLETLNQNVVAMMALNQGNAILSQLTESSALIGKNVTWLDPNTGDEGSGAVESVKLVDGLAVLQVDGRDVLLATVSEVQAPSAASDEEVGS